MKKIGFGLVALLLIAAFGFVAMREIPAPQGMKEVPIAAEAITEGGEQAVP